MNSQSVAILAQGTMRRARSGNETFDVTRLASLLEPLARDKSPPCDFELSGYGKTRRSQGPDREGLQFYAPLLMAILTVAPTGYPSLVLLRETWLELQRKFQIMGPGTHVHRDPSEWATIAADRIRLCLKHVVDLKKSATTFMPSEVRELVETMLCRHVQMHRRAPYL